MRQVFKGYVELVKPVFKWSNEDNPESDPQMAKLKLVVEGIYRYPNADQEVSEIHERQVRIIVEDL